MNYIENGNEAEFFRCLEYVIKARTTVSELQKKLAWTACSLWIFSMVKQNLLDCAL